MMDYTKRLRAPALIAVLAIIGILLGVAIGQFVLQLSQGNALALAARAGGSASPSLIWTFAALALAIVIVVARPAPPGAAKLVTAAAVVVSLAAGIGLVFWVLGLASGFSIGAVLGAVGGLIETAVKAACAFVLWRLRELGVEEQSRITSSTAPTGEMGGQPPVWTPEQAVGRQWNRAGDAATGAGAQQAMPALPAAAPAPAAPPVPEPEPVRRQLWSRGGVAPDQLPATPAPPSAPQAPDPQLPWTTAAQAAGGQAAGAEHGTQPPDPSGRPAPDWTPAPRPEEPIV